jgi:periplasmic divalent cation tolerance protein
VTAEVAIAFVTCPPAAADALARALVEARVAACVNQLPGLRSTYRWKGEICTDEECLLMIKFPAAGFEALRAAVLAHHPYELPEVIEVKIDRGHLPYLDWVIESCR